MDLRPLIKSARQIEDARRLALRGLLSYQPYIFSDSFATGAGLSILAGHLKDPPAVYCPDATADDTDPTFFAREFAKEEQRKEFFSANEAMRRFYDGMVDQIAAALGPLEDISVLDVGCNTGYFPLAFARRGARHAKGIDRIDYSPTVSLLNDICGTSVQFAPWNYDGSLAAFEQHDLVLSIAVLVHLSEPLRHLAWLGSSARKALMVFTPSHGAAKWVESHAGTRPDTQPGFGSTAREALGTSTALPATPDYSIKYHAVNRYYVDAQFPNCFDITTLSEPLLRLAFEKMGFSRIVEITAARDTMPPDWADVHLGLLGIREDSAAPAPPPQEVSLAERDQRLAAYVREQLSPLQDTIDKQAERLKSLESTVEERTGRLDAMERTVEERSNRITSLEASLEAARRRSIRYRLGTLVRRGTPEN